jgi:hypothetical protein
VRNAWVAAGFGALTGVILGGVLRESHSDQIPHYVPLFLLQAAVLAPLSLGTHLTLPDLMSQLLNTLRTNDAIGERRPDVSLLPCCDNFGAFTDQLRKGLNWRRWGALSLTLSAAYVAYRLRYAPIWSKYPSGWELFWGWLAYGAEALALYWGALSIIRIGVVSLFVSRLARVFEFCVKPLHPDGCGGFQQLGYLFTRLVQLAAVLGLTVVGMAVAIGSTGTNPATRVEWWVLGLVYLVLLPMLVIAFLLVPHQNMAEARSRVVHPVAKSFEACVLKARPADGDTAFQIYKKTLSLSQIVVQVRTLNEAYPVWPIRVVGLQQAAATALLPLIVPVGSAIIIKLVVGNPP